MAEVAWKDDFLSGAEQCALLQRQVTMAQAGLKALCTCTSWYAYAAMFGSSKRSLI